MTRHEHLLEEYEDAYFALLMEDVMVQEEARLEAWNQALQNDPAAAVPGSLDRRCLQTIRRYAFLQRRGAAFRQARKVLQIAAVIAAVMATLFTSAFAVSEEFRTAALELVRTVTGQYTQLDIRRTGETNGRWTGDYFQRVDVGWIPEGFSYCGGEYDVYAEFENGRGQSFRVEVYPENPPLDFDAEIRSYDYQGSVFINGNQSRCFTREDAVVIDASDQNNGFHFVVRAFGGISVDTATKIMMNIRRSPHAAYFENAEILWLPEGLTYQEGRYDWYAKFADGEGRWLWVYLYNGFGSLHIDTVDANFVEDVFINGNQGLCVVKNGYVHIVTTDLARCLYIDVIASDGFSPDTVKEVVEHIKLLP